MFPQSVLAGQEPSRYVPHVCIIREELENREFEKKKVKRENVRKNKVDGRKIRSLRVKEYSVNILSLIGKVARLFVKGV